MKILSPSQVSEVLEIVDAYIYKHIGTNIGMHVLDQAEKKILMKHGIKIPASFNTVSTAFHYGIVAQSLGSKNAKGLDFREFSQLVKSKNFLPLSMREKQVLKMLEYQAYHEIKGLGNKISNDLGRAIIEGDKVMRAGLEDLIKETAKEAVVKRKGVKEMGGMLGRRTRHWGRDWHRVSDYILHEAHDWGMAVEAQRVYGKDAYGYKQVMDRGCSICHKLYYVNGKGGEPIVFKVKDLMANGSNIGRDRADMRPVIGATKRC